MAFDEKFKDKTTLECWVKIEDDSSFLDANGEIIISPSNPKLFKSGTIIETPLELQENTLYTYHLYKVAVGKSLCFKKEAGQDERDIPFH